MSGSLAKLGLGAETVYGTAVAPTYLQEFISEDIRGTYPRLQAESLSSALVDRSDRFAINAKGAAGTIAFEPFTRGFGNWLYFAMGAVNSEVDEPEADVFTHTATIADLSGQMLTVQVGRPDETATLRPWTYEGGKVTGFELSNSVDQTLRASMSLDFEKESNPDSPAGAYAITALNALSSVGGDVLNWQGGLITLDGVEIEVAEISVRVDNALNTNRWFIGAAGQKKEPRQDGKRSIEFSIRTPYVNNNFWEKVSSATPGGALGEIVAKWTGPTLIGTTTYPSLKLTIPAARFDEGGPVVSGPSQLEQTITGRGLFNGTDSALEIEYVTLDETLLGA